MLLWFNDYSACCLLHSSMLHLMTTKYFIINTIYFTLVGIVWKTIYTAIHACGDTFMLPYISLLKNWIGAHGNNWLTFKKIDCVSYISLSVKVLPLKCVRKLQFFFFYKFVKTFCLATNLLKFYHFSIDMHC